MKNFKARSLVVAVAGLLLVGYGNVSFASNKNKDDDKKTQTYEHENESDEDEDEGKAPWTLSYEGAGTWVSSTNTLTFSDTANPLEKDSINPFGTFTFNFDGDDNKLAGVFHTTINAGTNAGKGLTDAGTPFTTAIFDGSKFSGKDTSYSWGVSFSTAQVGTFERYFSVDLGEKFKNNGELKDKFGTVNFTIQGTVVDTPFTDGTAPAPVPEPEEWAMMMLGLPLMGFVARRRRTA